MRRKSWAKPKLTSKLWLDRGENPRPGLWLLEGFRVRRRANSGNETHVSKHYGGIAALSEVDFVAFPGEIHAVLGENGAGKSTLIKIAAGVTDPSAGEVYVAGKRVNFRNPTEAMAAGVVCVFQELSLLPDMTVADNLSIVSPPLRGGLIDSAAQRERARELLAMIGCEDIHPLELVRNLPLSRRQMVEIAKALAKRPKLLILDEATSALTAADVERVYAIIRRLRSEGAGILYVSHRMHEIEALADCATVFRNGRRIETFRKGERSVSAIVQMMIGRELIHHYPEKPTPNSGARVALSVKNLSWGQQLRDISFDVRKGEIVGLGGLDGQGQRSLLFALFGVLKGISGTVEVLGKPLRLSGPRSAMRAALPMALIPEDRKTEGLVVVNEHSGQYQPGLAVPFSKGIAVRQGPRTLRGRKNDRKPEYKDLRPRGSSVHALGRQSAKGGAGQMVDDGSGHHPSQ